MTPFTSPTSVSIQNLGVIDTFNEQMATVTPASPPTGRIDTSKLRVLTLFPPRMALPACILL